MRIQTKVIAISLLILALFSSSRIPRRNLRSTAQVAGIALDQGEDGLIATFEIYEAKADETIGTKRKTAVGRGKSLDECIGNILYTEGDELFINDASVLVIGSENSEAILEEALKYYRKGAHNHMDLPVFFSKGRAGALFEGEGEVISMALAASAEQLDKTQTIKDLLNDAGERVYVEGYGGYEIQK